MSIATLIETENDINFLVESFGGYATDYDVTFSASGSENPLPFGYRNTNAIQTENDQININGYIRELNCDGTSIDTSDYLRLLKRTIDEQKYDIALYATITTQDGTFTNMFLTNVNWRRSADARQEILVSMTWQSANVAGSIKQPSITTGGLV